jgi:hypothetical protein
MGQRKSLKKKFLEYLALNGSKNITHQNLWDTAKAVLRGKFIASSI